MTSESLNVVFMGTPEFSVPALRAILHSPHKVICVYSQPPRGRGRGYTVQKSPVHEAAEQEGIEVRNPLSLKKDPAAQQDFIALKADIAVVAAYGLILPKAVLDAPPVRLRQYPCLFIAALAWGLAYSARYPGRGFPKRHHLDADGGRAGYRPHHRAGAC